MIATMAIELGINRMPQDAVPVENFTTFDDELQLTHPIKSHEELEIRRTFLGCYYISSM
jgi:hypothetical protein